jgi:hypothetical protein
LFRLEAKKRHDFAWFTSKRKSKNLKRKRTWNKRKLSEKIEVKRKLREKIDKNVFFFTRNEIGKRNNAKNIEFCFFWSEKVFPSFRFEAKITTSKRNEKL